MGCSPEGVLLPADVEAALRPNTAMIALTHASNVVGTLLPIDEVGLLARRRGVPLLVDAAQTAGAYLLDMQALHIDLLAFTGHKALLGPMGTGLDRGARVRRQAHHAPQAWWHWQPLGPGGAARLFARRLRERHPERAGPGRAAGRRSLGARPRGKEIRRHEVRLAQRLIDGLEHQRRDGAARDAERQAATVSFNVAGLEPSEVGLRLDDEHGVLCRVGLHLCAGGTPDDGNLSAGHGAPASAR